MSAASGLQAAFQDSYVRLAKAAGSVKLVLVTYYDDVEEDVYRWAVRLPVSGLHLDFLGVRGECMRGVISPRDLRCHLIHFQVWEILATPASSPPSPPLPSRSRARPSPIAIWSGSRSMAGLLAWTWAQALWMDAPSGLTGAVRGVDQGGVEEQ